MFPPWHGTCCCAWCWAAKALSLLATIQRSSIVLNCWVCVQGEYRRAHEVKLSTDALYETELAATHQAWELVIELKKNKLLAKQQGECAITDRACLAVLWGGAQTLDWRAVTALRDWASHCQNGFGMSCHVHHAASNSLPGIAWIQTKGIIAWYYTWMCTRQVECASP